MIERNAENQRGGGRLEIDRRRLAIIAAVMVVTWAGLYLYLRTSSAVVETRVEERNERDKILDIASRIPDFLKKDGEEPAPNTQSEEYKKFQDFTKSVDEWAKIADQCRIGSSAACDKLKDKVTNLH